MDLAELKPWPGIGGRVALVSGAARGMGQAEARPNSFDANSSTAAQKHAEPSMLASCE